MCHVVIDSSRQLSLQGCALPDGSMSQQRNMKADKSKQPPGTNATENMWRTWGVSLDWRSSSVFLPVVATAQRFWLLRRYLKQQKVPRDLCFRATWTTPCCPISLRLKFEPCCVIEP